jgi:hypothetical protein
LPGRAAADEALVSASADIPRPRHDDVAHGAPVADRQESRGTAEDGRTGALEASVSDPSTAPVAPAGAPRPARRVRASDQEREETVQVLHGALGEGRLDLLEAENRVAAAYRATYRDELPLLVEDLPPSGGAEAAMLSGREAPTWRVVWIALVWRARAAWWDGPDGARTAGPPGPDEQRLAAALVAVAMAWVLVFAVAGAIFT